MHYMELGGAEISLIGLLQALDYSKFEVDLFIYRHQGELMELIPKEVNLLPEIPAYACIESPMAEALRRWQFRVLWGRIKAKWLFSRYLKKKNILESTAIFQYTGDCVSPVLPSLSYLGEYDLAISFLNPHNIVRDKVLAKNKACWIHTDYMRIDINVEQELSVWSSFDYIVSISPDVTKNFLQVFPSLIDRIIEIENILSPDFIRMRAEESDVSKEIPKDGNVINILSVGRFCEAKNYDNVPDICRRIRDKGLEVNWYIIGYGNEALIRQRIKEAGMEEFVKLLGKRTNPYPYMKACDIYAQPSRYEGKSVTVREAQMLCKPVVITNYATAKSQLQDGVDGVIVPKDNEGCAKGIEDFIRNKQLQNDIINYLHDHDYGNVDEVEKVYRMI